MIAQTIIWLFGVTSIWLANDANEQRRKWACLLGLLSSPAFLWAAWEVKQWGNFAASMLCLFCWLRGFRQHWIDGRGIRWSPKA